MALSFTLAGLFSVKQRHLFQEKKMRARGDAVMRRQMSSSSSDRRVHQPSSHLRSMMSVITAVLVALGTILNFIIQGFKRMHRGYAKYQVIKYHHVPCSPLTAHRLSIMRKKILVLDLDETLIHSHHDGVIRPMVKPGTPSDFTIKVCFPVLPIHIVIKVVIDRHPVRFSVHARPHVDYFLSVVSQWFDLVVFTASMEVYGTHVADKLDNGRGILNRRYFRQHCTMDYGGYTKDLSAIHQDLSSIFILDNSPGAYRKFPLMGPPVCRKCDSHSVMVLGSIRHVSAKFITISRCFTIHIGCAEHFKSKSTEFQSGLVEPPRFEHDSDSAHPGRPLY
ncbi:Dullard-like phosphatase domain protein [Necator americanus]|uniref:Dullard-like phosphatase domain protein n=1 Tax=Necator americanus TaxID=51031 RepID=W2TBC1_NECAM|nr:Dullard-like phosphatase domain protein [Necator americanus]ETN79325.1 Dullard-like phosphatase domain protein [Necator americanus]